MQQNQWAQRHVGRSIWFSTSETPSRTYKARSSRAEISKRRMYSCIRRSIRGSKRCITCWLYVGRCIIWLSHDCEALSIWIPLTTLRGVSPVGISAELSAVAVTRSRSQQTSGAASDIHRTSTSLSFLISCHPPLQLVMMPTLI